MGQKLGDNVMKVLNERGIAKKLAKGALEIARQRSGFTIFALVDALTRLSGKLANAGDRSEADAKASATGPRRVKVFSAGETSLAKGSRGHAPPGLSPFCVLRGLAKIILTFSLTCPDDCLSY